MEAEYVVVAEATKKAIWLARLIFEMGLAQDRVRLDCHSQSALYLVVNNIMDCRVKHIDVYYHFIRQDFLNGRIELVKIDGTLYSVSLHSDLVVPCIADSRWSKMSSAVM